MSSWLKYRATLSSSCVRRRSTFARVKFLSRLSAGLTLDAGSLTMVDATHYTATVTADDDFTGTATVSLAAGSYTDAALNLGGAGSDSVTIDTENPTVVVNIVDGALSDGDNNSLVTFASSEAPGASFTESDIHEPGWGNKPAVFEGKRTAWLIDGKTGEPPVVAGARL